MTRRSTLAAIGVGIAMFLSVTVLVIEALSIAFSAIVALPVGLLVGVAIGMSCWRRYDRLSRPTRSVLDGVAGFGFAVVAVLAIRYVDLLGLRSALSFDRLLVVAIVTALLVAVSSWLTTGTEGRRNG